jgi:carboxyl-terminal processing protease
MRKLLRPLAVFSVSSALSLSVLTLVDASRSGPPRMLDAVASGPHAHDHDLAKLWILHEVLLRVREDYVDPARISPEGMLVAALDAVERRVPAVLLQRDGQAVVVSAGNHREVVMAPTVRSLDDLERVLERVATVLAMHLSAEAVPDPDPGLAPLAEVEVALANGVLSTLDPHSALLPPSDARELEVDNRGEFGGLGITIGVEEGRLVILEPMPGSPAARAGVRPGDHIRRIDGEPTLNATLDDAVELLRGPVGSDVTLELVRDGVAQPFSVRVKRDRVASSPVEGAIMPGGFAYVRVPAFHASVAAELREELTWLARENGALRGLVLDLRDNPGGYLKQAEDVADLFLASGEIVSTRSMRSGAAQSREVAVRPQTQDDYPLVVLVNAGSASAAEVVAGALRNNDRAVIVGERSFGKGSVQTLHDLAYDTKLKITIAQYYTPGDQSIQGVGVPADIALRPAWTGRRRGMDGVERPTVALFADEGLRREADLDARLPNEAPLDGLTAYTVRTLLTWDHTRLEYGIPDPATDPDLRFALDLLAEAPSARRGEILAGAEPVVRRWAAEAEAGIVRAFRAAGVDWAAGAVPAPEAVTLDVSVDVPGGALRTGEVAPLTLRVRNRGAVEVPRLVAVIEDAAELGLEGMEWPLGRLPIGAERASTRHVYLPAGMPSSVLPLRVSLRVAEEPAVEVGEVTAEVPVEGVPLPRLAWRWWLEPPSDGQLDVGDTARLRVEVVNEGDGPAVDAFVRLRNRAGRAVDIGRGTLALGAPSRADGAACRLEAPGWEGGTLVGDDPDHPRAQLGEPALWDAACARRLAPGAVATGVFEVQLLDRLEAGYRFELLVDEGVAGDTAEGVGVDLGAQAAAEVQVALGPVTASPSPRRVPPRIDITREPPLEASGTLAGLSGRVFDDGPIDHVLVWVNGDKAVYEGGVGGVTELPFAADATLVPGRNVISVVARGADGLVSSVTRVVYMPEAGEARLAEIRDPSGERAAR